MTDTSIVSAENLSAASAWAVYANATESPNSTFTGGQLSLPLSNSSSLNTVKIISESTLTDTTSDFLLYGYSVFAKENGKYQNPFYTTPTNSIDIWYLIWNPVDPNNNNLDAIVLRSK